ncbi:hypothetical protein GCM10022258_42500 [Aquimarina gracilis]
MFLLFFTGCHEEELLPEETEQTTETVITRGSIFHKKGFVSQEEIPDVMASLKSKMPTKSVYSINKIQDNGISIYLDKIKNLSIKGQHTNYTFPVSVEGSLPNELFMLSIDQNTDGSIEEPIMIKYTMSQKAFDYVLANDGEIDYRYFKADYAFYDFGDFLKNKDAAKFGANGCSGTGSLGADPGEYPTMQPNQSFTNNGTTSVFGGTTLNSNVTYIFTSNVTDDTDEDSETSTVSVETNVRNIESSFQPPNLDYTGNIISSANNTTASLSINVGVSSPPAGNPNPGGGGGIGSPCSITHHTDVDGHVLTVIDCVDIGDDANLSAFSNRTVCEPIDYVGLNLTDLRLESLNHFWSSLDRSWLEQHRAFLTPLVDFRFAGGQESFAKKIQDAEKTGKVNEVEGMQILYYINQNNSSEESDKFGEAALDAWEGGGDVDLEDEIIIDPSVNDCASDIINRLKLKDTHGSVNPDIFNGGNSHISQFILDMFDANPNHHLVFNVEQLGLSNGNELNGRTHKNGNIITITIDEDLVNDATQLFMAKTIIHESMHAFIQHTYYNDFSSTIHQTIRSLYQTYAADNTPRTAWNMSEHEFISNYVEALAMSLASWDFHKQSIDYYKMLSWGGLETSVAYQRLSEAEKTNIQNAIQNERNNRSGAKGETCP